MEVTASGVPRPRRNQLAQLVERLRGTWSGALNVGRTTAVVVEGPEADIDWVAAKLAVAQQHGIPVVSADWLLDSQAHGFLLSTAPYRLEPPPPGRRSSAASTSAAAAPPRPAHTTATVNQADTAVPPAQLQQPTTEPDSPAVEVEVLRGEAAQPRLSPLPPQRSPQAQTAGGTPTSKPHMALDELPEPLVSPAAGSQLQYAGGDSPALTGSPLQLLALAEGQGESAGHSAAAALPPFSPCSSGRSSGEEAGQGASPWGASPAWTPGSPGLPAGGADAGGAAVTPAPLSAGTDSDTKIARFLSRRPMVTMARGSCLPRRCLPTDSSSSSGGGGSCAGSYSSSGTSICSSLSGSGSGSAERMEHAQRYGTPARPATFGMILTSDRLHWAEGADGQGNPAAAEVPSPAAQSAGQQWPGSACARSPAVAHTPESAVTGAAQLEQQPAIQHSQGMLRMDPPVAEGRLPATTLVRLGPQLHRPPLRSTWEGLLERHGCGSCDSEGSSSGMPAVTFHASAEALPEGGAAVNFVAGDERHGAVMLYDIREDGRRVYALALVQAIYRWRDEVWMEHRYLLTREDLQERPSWAAALQGLGMRAGEVLLTANTYFSPMHLIAGDFSLNFPGRAQRARRGQQAQAGSRHRLAAVQRQPARRRRYTHAGEGSTQRQVL